MGNADRPESDQAVLDWSVLERIVPEAARRWPPLGEARVKVGWAGLYENTPDAQPLVGPVAPGLWIAAGFSGHGFMMGPVIGDWLAQWMTAGASPVDLAAFRPDRFRQRPLTAGTACHLALRRPEINLAGDSSSRPRSPNRSGAG